MRQTPTMYLTMISIYFSEAYFDLGLRKISQPGAYHYMCTTNNDFSNRSQKGRIICNDHARAEMRSVENDETGSGDDMGLA